MKLTPTLTGVAGEYFVAAELSRRGFIASISLRNTRGIDILATNEGATCSVTIQCKTAQAGSKTWILNEKAESFHSPTHFYVFIALGEVGQSPEYHVVPSTVVARTVRDGHRLWLKKPGRNGRKHVDNPVRKFSDLDDAYLNRWDLLGL